MTPPVRWLEADGDAPRGASRLLSAARPPPAFSDAVRQRLAVGVAKTAALPVTSVWASLLVKSAVVTAIGGACGLMVHSVAGGRVAPVPPPAPAITAVSAAPRAVAAPAAATALPVLQLPTVVPDRAPPLKLDARLAEAELLEQARSLVASNPAAALKLISEHGRDFPRGRLGAEADLIAAQSLLAMGKVSAAQRRARASLARYPGGLYARQLRAIAGP